MKTDIAIQSFNKPESLVFSLLSLHRQSAKHVETVFINDDSSDFDAPALYGSGALREALRPWAIRTRVTQGRTGWRPLAPKGVDPAYLGRAGGLLRKARSLYHIGRWTVPLQDVRYQWAFEESDKAFVYVTHDDVLFRGDVIGAYLDEVTEKTAIVGDLGQCWRCPHGEEGCEPSRIVSGYRPSPSWPATRVEGGHKPWACRINEWSALVSTKAQREILDRDGVLFGNYESGGDIGAYWLNRAIARGYTFADPLPSKSQRDIFYLHGWAGFSGHSVWVDQGQGKARYDAEAIQKLIRAEFGLDWKDLIREA